MNHKLTFFPLGNADCSRIDLANGKKMLVDYAATRDPNKDDDRRCDLPSLLRDDLDEHERNHFEVVAFTHLDQDHYQGASEFFHLDYAAMYQDGNRVEMREMWIPAGFLLEQLTQGASTPEAKVLRSEARYRFKKKKGIRVFGRPDFLKAYCEEQGISLDERRHLIINAGNPAPGFTMEDDDFEVFVHSPFSRRIDDNLEDRNTNSFMFQGTFQVASTKTKALFFDDADCRAIRGVVRSTKEHDNEDRLAWHVAKVPHHCSYKSIAPDGQKGTNKTKPEDEEIDWLYRDQQQRPGILVSPSRPIPIAGSAEDEDVQPPHRQAAAYYKDVLDSDDDFHVTMSHPEGATKPQPIVIEITSQGPSFVKETIGAGVGIITGRGERNG